jgi:hypothetical protein
MYMKLHQRVVPPSMKTSMNSRRRKDGRKGERLETSDGIIEGITLRYLQDLHLTFALRNKQDQQKKAE